MESLPLVILEIFAPNSASLGDDIVGEYCAEAGWFDSYPALSYARINPVAVVFADGIEVYWEASLQPDIHASASRE